MKCHRPGFSMLLIFATYICSAQVRTDTVPSNSPIFMPPVTYSTGGQFTSSVAAADLNGDFNLDLIVIGNCGPVGVGGCFGAASVGVLLGKDDGTFQEVVTYPTGGCDARSLAVADVNGDGRMDVVVANFCGLGSSELTNIAVFLGNGDGTLQPPKTSNPGGFGPLSVAVADLNGDGKPDFIVANWYNYEYYCCPSSNAAVLLGNGDGTFQAHGTYLDSEMTTSVAVADVNGDSQPDVVVALACQYFHCEPGGGGIAILINRGDGTFQDPRRYSSGGDFAYSVAVADFNHDGRPDVAVGNYSSDTVGVLLGNGDGTFLPAVTYDAGGEKGILEAWLTSVAIADINGDGKPDLIATNSPSDILGVLLGNGDGTFQTAVRYSAGESYLSSVVVADVSRDGKPDLAVAGQYINGYTRWGSVAVMLNNTPCISAPVVRISATPTVLWPPTGQIVPVTVSGTITDAGGCIVRTLKYAVKDEYGKVQPSGAITVGTGGVYSFIVPLAASRLGSDLDGRLYTVSISAVNNAGEVGSQAINVIVPHDRRH